MGSSLAKTRRYIGVASTVVAALLLLYLAFASLMQILARNTGLVSGVGEWSESARYAMISMTFLGLASVAHHTADVTIDVFDEVSFFRKRMNAVFRIKYAFSGLFLAFFGYASLQRVLLLQQSGQSTPSLAWPIAWPLWPVVLGSFMGAIVCLLLVLSGPDEEVSEEHTDPAGVV